MNTLLVLLACLPAQVEKSLEVKQTSTHIHIETDALQARINKQGYVSGLAAGSFLDRKTGAKDVGFGLHIMDFLLAPGWRDDGYTRDRLLHGRLAKHYIEGPQICTQAKKLQPEVITGKDFVAVRMQYKFTTAARGLKAGSTWEQTILFQPGLRYVLCSEQITSVNDVDNLFYRIDMPGHVRHKDGDSFSKVYLSYLAKPLIDAKEFRKDFAPDDRFLYQRVEGKEPNRMIRAYQVKVKGKPGPWLAGIALDPRSVSEAWCHQRGYICFIQELHGKKVKAGDTFGAAYAVGWFDDIESMEKVCDLHKGKKRIRIEGKSFKLE